MVITNAAYGVTVQMDDAASHPTSFSLLADTTACHVETLFHYELGQVSC